MIALVAIAALAGGEPSLAPIASDRVWQVLDGEASPVAQLRAAGQKLGTWSINLGGVEMDGPWLVSLATDEPEEPLLRRVREVSGRAVDLEDFLWFLDDVLAAGEAGRRGEPFFVPAGRARAAGILVHPDDVFRNKPRVYGVRSKSLAVDEPQPQETYPPAADGDPPGPGWTMRYLNPSERYKMWAALHEARPESTYPSRVASLVIQLEHQGAEVYMTSTVRHRHRGYLMWGAFELSRAKTEAEVDAWVERLVQLDAEWKLATPISWRHPDGWEATIEAARQMADTYDVVYATEKGARYSKHYDGVAADFVAIALPRELTLYAPDGAVQTFDLSDPEQTRDLSLSPELIWWVETHFGMSKLKSDYPHWNDNAK